MKTPSYYRGGKKMKKFKVLRVVGNSIYSPLQNYYYGEIKEVIGKKFICDDFSKNEKECDKGFYATDIDGLIYCMNNSKSNRIFEVEVGGRSKVFNEYKQRYEEQTIVRMLSENEVRQLIREQSDKMDWDYYHACYPVNPLELDIPFNKDKALKLLKEWASAWDSVRASAWDSVQDSVWDSVGDSVWDSVWDSVGDSVGDSVQASVLASVRASVSDSVWAYISSLFPNIKKWKYIEHKEGVNPFQSSIDLWHMGLVPSFDGEVWRLHKGEKAEVVLEITGKELRGVKE
jgi:hypothetical protein